MTRAAAAGRPAAATPGRDATRDCILRRTKDDVQSDMPPKLVRDVELDLTPAQQYAYDRAETDGVVHLNELGETVSVQHVFQLVMRLKQICNFDPLTGESAKLDQLKADMEEVAASGRKAIVFSQWVEPLGAPWPRRWRSTARCSTTAASPRPSGRRSWTASRTTRTPTCCS